jgi:hypothetical protein
LAWVCHLRAALSAPNPKSSWLCLGILTSRRRIADAGRLKSFRGRTRHSLRPRQENLQTLSNPNRQDANSRLPSLPIDNTLRPFESDRPSPQQRSLNGGHPVEEGPRLAQPTPSAARCPPMAAICAFETFGCRLKWTLSSHHRSRQRTCSCEESCRSPKQCLRRLRQPRLA